MTHKAGFINVIGLPNAGKSTFINALVGEKVAIVTPKPQTTRRRTMGIVNEEDCQMVFSDTPGVMKPRYEMQKAMMRYVELALEDADILILMVEAKDSIQKHQELIEKIKKNKVPAMLVINKIDLSTQEDVVNKIEEWKTHFDEELIIPVSATEGFNLERVKMLIRERLPESPPFYEKDLFTDRSERFLAAEVIREKVFFRFKEEVPYSTEVHVEAFEEEEDIIRIYADIWVNKKTQKPILIGNKGDALKTIGTQARKELEEFFQKKVYIELFVKVRENWRENPGRLKELGWES